MTQNDDELDEYGKTILATLRASPEPDPQVLAKERVKFLAQGESLRQSVSPRPKARHIGWINRMVPAFRRKEMLPMLKTLIALVIALSILAGSSFTVYAAQSSLPDEPLYPVKAWSEDVRLALTSSAQGKLDLTLDFTNRRVSEIASLLAGGKILPEKTSTRFQEELDAALELAAEMDDTQLLQALEQIRQHAVTQGTTMADLMTTVSSQANPTLIRLRERLQEQVRLCAAGETDPQGFRLQMRERQRNRQGPPNQTSTQPITTPSDPSNPSNPTYNGYGPGPGEGQTTGEPGHYGPGGGSGQSTPGSGGYGPGPISTHTP